MKITAEDEKTLRALEESLWDSKMRFDFAYMDSILSPDFFEFGRSGRIYKREETLAVEPQEINASLRNFAIHPISQDVVLVTYISEVDEQLGNRSSIWMKTSEGWQLRFHQGTPKSLE